MRSCSTCGRPPESVCEACLAGNPPAERNAQMTAETVAQQEKIVQRVQGWLQEIPDLVAEVSYYRTPGSAPTDPEARTGTAIPSHRLVITPDVADLLDRREKNLEPDTIDENLRTGGRRLGVVPTINLWCALVYAELGDIGVSAEPCCPRDQHTLARECAWLSRHCADILRMHDDFTAQIRTLRNDLRTACRVRDQYVPTCTSCGWRMEGQWADGEAQDQAPAWWRCTGCDNTVQHDAEVRRLALTQPPLTLRQINQMTGYPLRTLYNWEAEKRFLPVGVNKRGGKLYEIDHVRRAAENAGRDAG